MSAAVFAEQAAMERFGGAGTALLPWTRQMLSVVWEQLRLLVQVIYCSFMSVFQMFRFEVHVRITDESGQHIQHMSTAANPAESFLFSSLFDGDGGSNPLSEFCADVGDPFAGKSTAEALLSSLRADDLCDFVSRTAGEEEGIFIGHQSTWKMGFPGDWNVFVSSSDSSSSNKACFKSPEDFFKQDLKNEKVVTRDTSEDLEGTDWSSEEEQNLVEFDSEESQALWESLSNSSDPYNPFFFSACISTYTGMGKSKGEARATSDTDIMSVSKASEEMLLPRGLNIWVSRSDSESSWASSDDSSPDVDKEESERLWEFFSSPADPYNPMFFSACTLSSTSPRTTSTSTTVSKAQASLPAPPSKSYTDADGRESSFPPSSEDDDDDDEQLWKSLCPKDDPFHPLNFQACLQSSPTTALESKEAPDALDVHHTTKLPTKGNRRDKDSKTGQKPRSTKPPLPDRLLKPHSHPDKTLVPWKRPGQTPPSPPEERQESEAGTAQKKVRFSPVVQVHAMRTWPFARQASRKGHWEVMARDRDRFQRRIRETEPTIRHVLEQSHREKIQAYLHGALK
ncbi:protein phosphatase 1 regulatory subunit 15B [Scophthalmus maximus]|uniref:protein phosphatase 1 regulatory subunit 15B n=1 Tax=Scophthalmus maximus TaxID=52904 RepID=UPI001FA87AD1|nr:protein phosphatase 1 regulatory subunit 15B [Scophthalmus maximus]